MSRCDKECRNGHGRGPPGRPGRAVCVATVRAPFGGLSRWRKFDRPFRLLYAFRRRLRRRLYSPSRAIRMRAPPALYQQLAEHTRRGLAITTTGVGAPPHRMIKQHLVRALIANRQHRCPRRSRHHASLRNLYADLVVALVSPRPAHRTRKIRRAIRALEALAQRPPPFAATVAVAAGTTVCLRSTMNRLHKWSIGAQGSPFRPQPNVQGCVPLLQFVWELLIGPIASPAHPFGSDAQKNRCP